MFEYSFMVRALIGGIAMALVCGPLSFFVVVKRLAFAGMGISHAAFGGVALGLALGIDPLATAAGFCCLVALGIWFTSRRGRLHEDAVIGMLFVTAMAVGLMVIRWADVYNVDLMAYLFGSLLGLDGADLALILGLGAFSLLYLILFFKELLFIAFDEETARASGIPVDFIYAGFLVILALVIVVSIKLVGVILVSALLVFPCAVGLQWSRNYRGVVAVSQLAGMVSVSVGLYLSYRLDVSSGASIVLVLFAVFLLSLLVSPGRRHAIAFLRGGTRKGGDGGAG
ncbi:MAG: metal ABC transporter permease [Candidatus Geothermincolales bacterium]